MASPQALVARRRLGAALRGLREERKLTLTQVAEKLLISPSKLSRLETGQGVPQPRDVRDLANLYKVKASERDKLLRWVRNSRQASWWQDYNSSDPTSAFEVLPGMDTLIGYESDAVIARQYAALFIPALLQTEKYAGLFLAASFPDRMASHRQRLVELTMHRQRHAFQTRDSRLGLRVMLHEASLRQSVGEAQILRDQLAALLDRAELPNIQLRILTSNAPASRYLWASWQHFSFAGLDDDVVCVETPSGLQFIESSRDALQYEQWFDIWHGSLDEGESLDLIKHVMTTLG
jgi:transcriptional regulator with XRE-family HTH domain